MSSIYRLALAAAFLLGTSFYAVPQAQAAQGYANCNNFIESLPAVITSQGVWCLRKDLSTGISSGEAISIATHNVTIDCNDFKVGGLAGGEETQAIGIATTAGRRNAIIRNCNVRGFNTGIQLRSGGDGHLVEDNLVDYSREAGILIAGENNRAQRNRVFDTGGPFKFSVAGRGTFGIALGMRVHGDAFDNVITNVFSTSDATSVATTGIEVRGTGYDVRRNQVRNLMLRGPHGEMYAIDARSARDIRLEDNHLVADPGWETAGIGIRGPTSAAGFCGSNTVLRFTQPIQNCIAFRPSVTD